MLLLLLPGFGIHFGGEQRELLLSTIRRVEAYGAPPEFFSEEESLKEILAACDQYDMEPKHIALFNSELLNILKN